MSKLKNPFAHLPGYNCFGCSPHNPVGLRLKFTEEGDEIVSRWEPTPEYQGYFNILHGGIQATLMDEIASWTVYVKVRTAGFTSRAEVRYLKNVGIADGPLTLKSRLVQMRRNLADISVELFNAANECCARGTFTYFTYSPEKSKESMFYPDPRDFYDEPDESTGK